MTHLDQCAVGHLGIYLTSRFGFIGDCIRHVSPQQPFCTLAADFYASVKEQAINKLFCVGNCKKAERHASVCCSRVIHAKQWISE